MAAFVALLRAVNVGGTGKLPMSELKAMCEELGFTGGPHLYASGNVVFTSRKAEAAIKAALEMRLAVYAGKAVGVMVRSAAEMAQVSADNPFPRPRPTAPWRSSSTRAPPKETLAADPRPQGRRDRARKTRDLCPLRRGHGQIEAGHPRRKKRHRAQYEYRRDARENGRRAMSGSASPAIARDRTGAGR